jgi:hypothetical protein
MMNPLYIFSSKCSLVKLTYIITFGLDFVLTHKTQNILNEFTESEFDLRQLGLSVGLGLRTAREWYLIELQAILKPH